MGRLLLKSTLILIPSICIISGVARAAAVKQVVAKKDSVIVELDDDDEFEKDATVCFYTAAGKKIDCGQVESTKGSAATIHLESKKHIKEIKTGIKAKLAPNDDSDSDEKEPAPKTAKKPKKPKKAAKESEGASPKAAKNPLRIRLNVSPLISTPYKYNKISYEYPLTATPTSLWHNEQTEGHYTFGKDRFIGAELSVSIPFGTNAISPGFRYETFSPFIIDANYYPHPDNPYVTTEEAASDFALWFDFQFSRIALTPSFSLNLSSGLDIDNSTVTFKATKKDDNAAVATPDVASATSKLTVISLRLGGGLELMVLKAVGLDFGTTIMVPLVEASKKFSGGSGDDEGRGVANPGDDLKAALNHKKSSLAYEVNLGLVFAF